jgi:uncharacterized protein (TIGR02099 family)
LLVPRKPHIRLPGIPPVATEYMVKKSLFWFYRITLIALWTSIFVFTVSVLTLRYVVLPQIQDYKPAIEQRVSQAAGQNVTIGRIEASWNGLDPHLSLYDVVLHDRQHRPALTLGHIEASLSWLSIPLLEPRLSLLTIHEPELTVRREADGTLYVAGIPMGGPSRPTFANWLLRQSQIDVVNATVLWQDELRRAPPLTLNQLQFRLVSPAWESLIGHHRFGLQAVPSAGSSQPIDIRGNIYGKDVSQIDEWRGTIYGRAEGTDISAWRSWVSYPFDLHEGFGAAQFWADFSKGEFRRVTSDVVFRNVRTRLSESSQEMSLSGLSGRLKWIRHEDGDEIRAQQVKVATADGMNMQDGNIAYRKRISGNNLSVDGDAQFDEIRLETLRAFAAYLPLPARTMQQISDIDPAGELRKLNLRWKGATRNAEGKLSLPESFSIRTQFASLGMKAYDSLPGFSNLSGGLDATENRGMLTLNTRNAELDFSKVFRAPIPVDTLTGQLQWTHKDNETEYRFNKLAIANAHLAATANGRYLDNGVRGGFVDLQAAAMRADASHASAYYPLILSESLMGWLDRAIVAGRGEDIKVTLKGNLKDFPYPNDRNGLFKVTARITGGVLDFAEGWPRIEDISLDMLFHGTRMALNATAGSLLGNRITQAEVVIPVLNAQQPMLSVNGQAQGPVSEGIRYVNSSPILATTGGFTRELRATGNGKLSLQLDIPLHNIAATRYKGSYAVANGNLAGPDIPTLKQLNGKLDFTESALRAQNVNAVIFGGPAQFSLATRDKTHQINARGSITDAGLREAFGPGFADRLSGATDWMGEIQIRQQQVDVSLRSSMAGMASSLPFPLAKAAAESMPVRFEKKQQSTQQDTISLNLGNVVGARLLRTLRDGKLAIDRGEIGLNVLPEIPSQPGLAVRGMLEHLDADEWRNLLDKSTANSAGSSGSALPVNRLDVAVDTLDVFGRRINGLKLRGKATGTGWELALQSREITGDVQWLSQGEGKVVARLKNLIMPSATPDISQLRTQGTYREQAEDYPALDIVAENFEIGQKKLGRLELLASEQDEDWSIEKLRIVNPDSTLTAEGEWHNWIRSPNTRLTLTWDISDLGKTLERFGYPDVVKGGEADLTGQLKWPGSPHEFGPTNLSGNLQLDARKGQILKLKPGVGRLFSVLSLQNLPRRLTFDFRDIFGSGFTFDKVSANVNIDKGVMRSEDFRMEGPTALIQMRGQTDIKSETQHLYVKVTPYISDSLSIAALAGGPAVGAAAYIAQRLLKDPINKLAEDEYEIVGTWDKPIERNAEKRPAVEEPNPLGQ